MSLLHSFSNVKVKPSTNRLALRAVSVALMLIMMVGMFTAVMAGAVSATAWPEFQGDPNRTGQITNGTPCIGTNPKNCSYSIGSNIGGFNGEPVLETVNGITYAYMQYGSAGGARLEKINVSVCPPTQVWNAHLTTTAVSYQLATPYIGTTCVYVGVTGYFSLLSNTNFNSTSNWTLGGSATINTSNQRAVVPIGGTISQSFYYNGSAPNGQVVSGILLQNSGSAASVTFTVTNSTGHTIASYVANVNSPTSLTAVTRSMNGALPRIDTYTVTATVSGAPVFINYFDFSYSTCGIKAVDKATGAVSDVVGAPTSGQINTPIVKYGDYLYFGTYNGGNKYYQYNLNTTALNTFTGYSDFYWAGAYSDGTNVYFGGDGGYFYHLPVTNFNQNASTTNTITLVGAGDVRSSILRYSAYMYFTCKGGYLWRVNINNLANIDCVALPKGSTSTPAISQNEFIYVGYYSGPGGSGGVLVVPLNSFNNASKVDIYGNGVNPLVGTPGDAVQVSPIVYTDDESGYDFIYFATNVATGTGYCYNYAAGATKGGFQWKVGGSNFVLQGFASDNGILVYGDNGGKLHKIVTICSCGC